MTARAGRWTARRRGRPRQKSGLMSPLGSISLGVPPTPAFLHERAGFASRQLIFAASTMPSVLELPTSSASGMPSRLHEDLLRLFQNRPALAAELASRALRAELPEYTEVRVDSANLSDLRPAEYRADLVILLMQSAPVHGIIVEVQLARNEDKEYAWPAYVCNLRSRVRCPVCLLVVTLNEGVARWASRTIELGGENRFRPWVLGPSGVPEIADAEKAKEDPELAVLSAVAHGEDRDISKAVQIALAAEVALLGLDEERSTLYSDMLFDALSEAARRALRDMNLPKYEYKTEFARRYFGQGEAKGRAEIVLRQLTLRFGSIPDAVRARIEGASIEELDGIAERLLTAGSLGEALDPR
jgi:hypothetical protein